MLDAYTIRKAIPRILLAVIGINLSIYLCVAAIDITNIVGHGLAELIAGQFVDADSFQSVGVDSNKTNNSIAIGGAMITGLITAGAIFAPGAVVGGVAAGAGLALLGVLVPFLISVALITLAILFTLIIRQGLLIFLTIVSPVAIALFVLPGTEKYFKKWLDLFVKTLMVYPIIASIFAISTAMGAILLGTAGDSPGGIGLAKILGAIIVVFAPLALIPFAFKLAGGAIATIMNAGGARAGSLSQRAGKGFEAWRNNPNSWAGKQQKRAFDERSKAGLTGGQVLAGLTGGISARAKGNSFRSGYGLASGALGSERSGLRLKEIGQMEAMQNIMNNDDALMAGMSFRDENGVLRTRTDAEKVAYLEKNGYSTDAAQKVVASVNRGLAVANQTEFDRFAAVQLAGTGTGFKGGGFAEMNQAIIDAAGGDRALEGNLVAAARSKATEARRYDLLPGFGTHMRLMQEQRNMQATGTDYDIIAEKVNAVATDNVLFTQGAGAIVGGRGDSVKNLMPAVMRQFDKANQELSKIKSDPHSTPEVIAAAEKERKRALASVGAMLDVAGQVSPENAQLLADGGDKTWTDSRGHSRTQHVEGVLTAATGRMVPVIGERQKRHTKTRDLLFDDKTGEKIMERVQIGTRVATVADELEALRGDEEFGQYRREYSNSTAAQASQLAQQAAAAGQRPGSTPPITPSTTPPGVG